MYKLSKCFNTTLKFLNKSGISKTLIEIKAKILAKDEGNKIAQIRMWSPHCGPLARVSASSKLLLKSQSNFLSDNK